MTKQTTIIERTAAREEEARGLRALARAVLRALLKLLKMIFGGTVGDITRDFTAAKGLAGRAAIAGAVGVEGVGKTLDLGYRAVHGVASGVGGLLGALVPRPPVGPADVAAAAAAQDNRETQANDNLRGSVQAAISAPPAPSAAARFSPPALSPVETVATVREAAALMQRKDPAAAEVIQRLPHQASNWMLLLSEADLARIEALPSGQIWRHVSGVEAAPGLRPISNVSKGFIPSVDELAEILKRSVRSAAQERHEVAAMSKRPGSAPRPRLPTEPLYGEEAERAFATAPRSAAY